MPRIQAPASLHCPRLLRKDNSCPQSLDRSSNQLSCNAASICVTTSQHTHLPPPHLHLPVHGTNPHVPSLLSVPQIAPTLLADAGAAVPQPRPRRPTSAGHSPRRQVVWLSGRGRGAVATETRSSPAAIVKQSYSQCPRTDAQVHLNSSSRATSAPLT